MTNKIAALSGKDFGFFRANFIGAAMLIGFSLVVFPLAGSVARGANDPLETHWHPNHFSSAEVRWNEQTGKFEVALCVWPADLEKALTQSAGKTVDLNKTEGVDRLIAKYVAERFVIRKPIESVPAVVPDASDESAKTVLSELSDKSEEKTAENPSEINSPAPSTSADTKPPLAEQSNTSPPSTEPTTASFPSIESSTANSPPAKNADGLEQNSDALPDHFRWVGFETNIKEAWLYFEIAGDTKPAAWEIENRVFFEFNEEQVNQIRFHDNTQDRSFSLKISEPTKEFSTQLNQKRNLKVPKIR